MPHPIQIKATEKLAIKTVLLSLVIGTLVGFVGIFFEMATSWVFGQRSVWVDQWFSNTYAVIAATFTVSALLAGASYYIVKRFAPETGGSGIPEIEASMQDLRPVRWWRVIPVKFLGGVGSLGSGMVLGREGPTVQLGANIGQMVADVGRVKDRETRHTLLAAGSAAGLTTAFNAPLAGILFVIEEMRSEFNYNLISVKAVFVGAVMATIACRMVSGQSPILLLGSYDMPAQSTLWLYLVLGLLFGVIGIGFNKFLLWLQQKFLDFYQGSMLRFVLTGAFIGGCCGLFGLYLPQAVGGGFDVVHQVSAGQIGLGLLMLVFVLRFLTSTISFSSGAAGGIFSPLLALGASFGGIFGYVADMMFPESQLQMGSFVIAGMGALFAATVRAPLTGTVLVLEMTASYTLLLPMIITCLGATIVAQWLGGRPLYTVLMEKILERNGIPYERKE
ncbi:H(+)/Cl(-) exchange transporter ClcA [Comamonas kerstersii]|uniref:Chloride channel protein n=1 Tax=Comamonas kerstersii TaxID=225992 RepID=A0A0W7YY90_9BURK|nr:H(+)/Cl(-) exchange transporter ClcA [Comamonas kerstersii]AQZ99678.1 chloride channel protein [Comamonas kerstersii]KUF39956.1 ClC family H(+)/Cl(-) exchange transporter [Comamonas kerstersii]OOH85049.1 chloride channel protein [Comamonas kerstersii]OOH93371.1 chloride channel protein [Comamonas kerstersii]QTW18426.1 H(+)/Cl(-) exchange transporter ClcA [Comamonas kerstersii]